MKKNVIIIAIVVIIAIVIKIVAVNMDKNVNIDMQKLAEELKNEKIFEDNLSQIDRDTIIKRYNFNSEKIKNINSYVGTGATAEEILIIELVDKKDRNEIEKIIETKLEERKADFQTYLPEEVFKLENYNLESKGNYIILCVSNDYDKAKEIINKYTNS